MPRHTGAAESSQPCRTCPSPALQTETARGGLAQLEVAPAPAPADGAGGAGAGGVEAPPAGASLEGADLQRYSQLQYDIADLCGLQV